MTDEQRIDKVKAKIAKEEAKVKKAQGSIALLEDSLVALGAVEEVPDTIYITTRAVEKGDFISYIDLSAEVSSDKNLGIIPETPGLIKRISVKEGQRVSAGQSLAQIDNEVLTSSIAELEKALELATVTFEKRDKLWKQNIGSEIEYLQAKNSKESLETKLATTRTQLSKTMVKSPISGTVESIMVKAGEMANGQMPIMQIVNISNVEVTAELSETYLGRVKRGDKVKVMFPSIDREVDARISTLSQVIDPSNRTFSIEIKLPNRDGVLKPNMMGKVRVREDFQADQVIIPSRLVQQSFTGDYVYVMSKEGTAVRKDVVIGDSYDGKTVVKEGLTEEDVLVDSGFRSVFDGAIVAQSQL